MWKELSALKLALTFHDALIDKDCQNAFPSRRYGHITRWSVQQGLHFFDNRGAVILRHAAKSKAKEAVSQKKPEGLREIAVIANALNQ